MIRLNFKLYLLISLSLFLNSCFFKSDETKTLKIKYTNWVKYNFNIEGNRILLIPKTGCIPCLNEGSSYLIQRLKSSSFTDLSAIVIITSNQRFYKELKTLNVDHLIIIFDKKSILDNTLEVDISNLTYLNFTLEKFKPIFTFPGFKYSNLQI